MQANYFAPKGVFSAILLDGSTANVVGGQITVDTSNAPNLLSQGFTLLPMDDAGNIKARTSVSPRSFSEAREVGIDYPTLEAAIIDLEGRPNNYMIVLPPGINTESIDTSQFNLSNISIYGATAIAVDITSVFSCTQISGYSHDVVLNVVDASVVSVGNKLTIRNPVGGVNPEQLWGVHNVTARDVVNNRITIRTKLSTTHKPSGAITESALIYTSELQGDLIISKGLLAIGELIMLGSLVVKEGATVGTGGGAQPLLSFYGGAVVLSTGALVVLDNLTFGNSPYAVNSSYSVNGHIDFLVAGNNDGTQDVCTISGGSTLSMWYMKVVNANSGIKATDLSNIQLTLSEFADCNTAVTADMNSSVSTDGTIYTRCNTNTTPPINTTSATGAFISSSLVADYTVGTLPTGVLGLRSYVTDALAPAYNAALTGGGLVKCPVFHNGAGWVSA